MSVFNDLSNSFSFPLTRLRQEARRISPVSVVLLSVVACQTLLVVWLYLGHLWRGHGGGSVTHFDGAMLIPIALFQAYFAFDAVSSESGMQLLMFLVVSFLLAFRTLHIYYDAALPPTSSVAPRAPLSVCAACSAVVAATLLHPTLCYHVHKSFGFLAYYGISANMNEISRYKYYQRYVSCLKLDVQFSIIGTIALAFYFPWTNAEYFLGCATTALTVLLSCLSIPMVQQENAAFCRAFMLYSFLVPVYELRKMHALWAGPPPPPATESLGMPLVHEESLRVYVASCAFLGLLARGSMLCSLQVLLGYFGEGTLIRVFEKRRRAATRQTDITPSPLSALNLSLCSRDPPPPAFPFARTNTTSPLTG